MKFAYAVEMLLSGGYRFAWRSHPGVLLVEMCHRRADLHITSDS